MGEPFKLRRRRESVTAQEVVEKLKQIPSDNWIVSDVRDVAVKMVEAVLTEMCGELQK